MSLTASYDTVRKTVALEMRWPRDPFDWTEENDDDFSLILEEGLRQFYRPPVLPGETKSHNWSFLYPLAQIELTPSFAIGTVGIVSGVATFTSTIPSWADEGDLWIDVAGDSERYTIDTRDSDTQVTLDNTGVDLNSGTSFTMVRRYYDLPSDFAGMASTEFTFRRDEQWYGGRVELVNERMIRERDREHNIGLYPKLAAITPVPPTSSKGTRYQVTFWPIPRETWVLEYRYQAVPATMSSGFPYHYGGADHSETVIASCVDRAYQRIHSSPEKHDYFLERLAQSVAFDRRNFEAANLGKGVFSHGTGSTSIRSSLRTLREHTNPSDINVNLS